MSGHKWTGAQRAKFIATVNNRIKEDVKKGKLATLRTPASRGLSEFLVHRGYIYKRYAKILNS